MRQKLSISVGAFGPSDVDAHIEAIHEVVKGLNVGLRRRDVVLTVHHWTTDTSPGIHPLGPQGKIDDDLEPDQIDIAIFVFWQRYGTPVHDANSGTEHELNDALDRIAKTGWPRLLVYFDVSRTASVDGSQLARVQSLRTRLEGLNVYYWQVNDRAHFLKALNVQLRSEVEKCIATHEAAQKDSERSLSYLVGCRKRFARQEGMCERLGDVVIRLTAEGADRPASLRIDVACTLNVVLSNRLVDNKAVTDCVLRDERTGQILARGVRTTQQSLVFRNISVTPGPGPQASRLVVSNLRAAIPGAAGLGADVFVQVEVSAREENWFVDTSPVSIATANVRMGLSFDVRKPSGEIWWDDCLASIPNGAPNRDCHRLDDALAMIRFEEGFAGAFSNSAQENHALGTDYAPTALRAVFRGIPEGINIWVSQFDVNRADGSCGPRASLLQAGADTVEQVELHDGLVLSPVKRSSDLAVVEWVWTDHGVPNQNDEPRTVDFAIFAFGEAKEGDCFTIHGTFSPINTTASACGPSVPIPRFVETGSARTIRLGHRADSKEATEPVNRS